jgi:energy-coupling factor transport system permease/ATP-binding protein
VPSELSVRGLTWRPIGCREPVLRELNLEIPAGQRVLLTGPSGSGKSTLLRAIAGVLETNESGDLTGSVVIDGLTAHGVSTPAAPSAAAPSAASGRGLGLLLQDPADAVVAHRVGRDVAFGLENLGVPRSQMWASVRAALAAVRFPYEESHRSQACSGGELQRLALAGVVVMRPGLLLLDEPTSMLDPTAAAAVRSVIASTAAEAGATVIVVGHDLAPWVDQVDRLVVLSTDGTVAADGPCRELLASRADSLAAQGIWVPGLAAPDALQLSPDLVAPWTDGPGRAGRPGLSGRAGRPGLSGRAGRPGPRSAGVALLSARGVGVRRDGRWVLSDVDADLVSGQVLALLGLNGAGKSTLVQALAGLLRPDAGTVGVHPELARGLRRPPYRWGSRDLAARVGWVPQHAEHAIVKHTVRDEIMATGRALGHDEATLRWRAKGLLEALGMTALAGANPYHLSGGEQRRLTLVTALAHGPDLLFLDEPTVGQDRLTWAAVTGVISAAREAGVAVAMATHDQPAVSALADARLTLDAGRPLEVAV